MIHDKMCVSHGGGGDGVSVGSPCYCEMIDEIRADERLRMAKLLEAKVCGEVCSHTACVVYFNSGRIIRGLAS